VTVSLFSDNVLTRATIKDVGNRIGGGDLSPDANRAVFGARGDIFTVPAEKGNIRNLTATPGIREREASWSPDGKNVAYLSDRTGEYEIWIRPADGKGEEKQLTTGSKTYKMQLDWSPDSKHLAVSDAAMNLWIVDADSGKMKKIDQGASGEIRSWNWSPQSDWIAYTKSEENNFNSIFLYNVAKGKIHRVTSDFTEDGSPCFDDEGKYLFFASARNFDPTLGGFDLKPIWTNMDGIYLVTLREDVEHPFPPESDEAEVDGDDDEDEADDEDKGKDKDGLRWTFPRATSSTCGSPRANSSIAAVPSMPAEAGADAAVPTSWSSTWKSAKPKRSCPRSGASPCRPTARKSSTPKTAVLASSTRRKTRNPLKNPCGPTKYRPRSIPGPNGARCSATPGVRNVIFSTIPACTGSTGTTCTSVTARWSPSSPMARTSVTSWVK